MLSNSGTPLMWFEFMYVTWANVLLGVLEGTLLAIVWRVGFVRSILVMTVANFASSLAGALLVGVLQHADITIANLHAWLWSSLAMLIGLTLVVELPFVRMLGPRATLRQVLRATLGVHALSYPLLLGFSWFIGAWSLLEWKVVPAAKLAPAGIHVVFYVDPRGERVWRRDLVAGGDVVVGSLEAARGHDELFLETRPDGITSLHVWLEDEATATVLDGLPGLVAPTTAPTRGAARLVTTYLTPSSPWRFQPHYAGGLACTGPGQERVLSPETPLSPSWWPKCVTQIADDVALVTIADQICLLKAATGEIALVARGRAAVVATVRR